MADTQKALAKVLDVSARSVSGWARRDDWPFRKRGPYDVEAVLDWRKATLLRSPVHDEPVEDDSTDDSTGGDAASFGGAGESRRMQLDNLLKAERAAKIRLEREILAGKYLKREDHVGAVLALIARVRDKMESFVETVPTQFEGLKESKIRLLARDWYDRFCQELQGEREIALVAEHDDGCATKDPMKVKAGKAKSQKR